MSERRKRRMGDRRDGRRLRSLDPYNELAPYIMKIKTDASNYFSEAVEISRIEEYLRGKRKQGSAGIGILHLFVAAYVRVVSKYPGVNRFISGQRIFSRNNIEFVMTIKTKLKTDASETSIKAIFSPADTIDDVYSRINAEIDKVKNEGEATDTDNVAKLFMKLPRLILKFAIFFFTSLDYFGLMPKAILKASPFHGSLIITDLGSIGLPAIYHHLYNFGNLPVFIALGMKRKAYELAADGKAEQRKYVDFKLVVDERICDGFYFSQAFKLFKNILQHPEVLEEPPETVAQDIE